jgi:signal transduction histidine kinase
MMRSKSTRLAQSTQSREPLVLSSSSTVRQGPLQAVWVGPALLLARRVRVEEGTFLQGCWLDWDAIRLDLQSSSIDLLPHARLEPVPRPGLMAPARMLASLPVRLISDPPTSAPEARWSPIRLSLWIAWACLALVAVAVASLLHGAVALSERRATFVSAVTHELRTPLTTFRLYAEMLEEGMVTGLDNQRTYLKTLRTEADRLGHLVENVLAFARLERGRASDGRESIAPGDLLERLVPRLAHRAQQSGMELQVAPRAPDGQLRIDVSVVDQILSNLVDNAVKFAGTATDRRIHLDVTRAGRWLTASVRDHGPGVAPEIARRLFRPFSKSARDAAQSAPGIGLGLALSRRLARAQGGDLRLQTCGSSGACFELTLPCE